MYYRYWYKKNYNKKKCCEYCHEEFYGNTELCQKCEELSEEGYIKQNDNGKWVKNPIKGNEYKFYDPNKKYTLKQQPLTQEESRFFNMAKTIITNKYYVSPQINLQTIIETNTNTRNDELFRNVDIGIFNSVTLTPKLLIEINGKQHYKDEYWIERDKSVSNILRDAGLQLLTIETQTIRKMTDSQLHKLIKIINGQIKKKKQTVDLSKIDKFISSM